LARRALHTVVSQGVSACATSPLALRQAPARRPGPACRGSPVHALRAHRLLARGRCLPRIQYCCPRAGGKELCPLRTTHGSGDAAARSRRGAPPRSSRAAPARDRQGGEGRGGDCAWCLIELDRGARDLEARAQLSTWLTLPEGGSTGLSCLAGQARSCCILPLLVRLLALCPSLRLLLLDGACEPAALSYLSLFPPLPLSRRCSLLSLPQLPLHSLSRLRPRFSPHAPCCCMPPRLLDVPRHAVPDHCVLLRHCSLPRTQHAPHLPTHHARHAHWLLYGYTV